MGLLSRQQIDDNFLFYQKKRFEISHIVSLGDNLHEIPNPLFWKSKKNISKCRLLKLPNMLIVNLHSVLSTIKTQVKLFH